MADEIGSAHSRSESAQVRDLDDEGVRFRLGALHGLPDLAAEVVRREEGLQVIM